MHLHRNLMLIAPPILPIILLLTGTVGTAAELPNIVLLMGDDHGWEETGYNGHPDVKTPVLDEMATQGLRLDRFYAGHPSCSPTRGSVLTGRHPNRYGTFNPGYSLRPEEITIAKLLGEAGYLRGHFGKWHVGTVKAGSPTNPGAMGFDEWVSHDNFFELNPPLSRNGGPPQIIQGESSTVVINETLEFIKRAKTQRKPFLAVVWFGSPHEPYSGLPADLAQYDHLPQKYADRGQVSLTSNETGRRVSRPLGEVLRERYAEITAMDRAIGKLRAFLQSEQLRNNTLLWYCGDNGTPPSGVLASPLRGRKGQVYEGGTRVPGLIEWPARITAPRTSEINAVTSDILPTVCELAKVPTPSDRPLDGISLAGLLNGSLKQRPNPIFFWSFNNRRQLKSNPKPWIAPALQKGTTPLVKLMGNINTRNFRNDHYPKIVDSDFGGARVMLGNQYKLVVHEKKGSDEPQIELFDIRADGAEKTNLAAAKPALVESMRSKLRDWQQSVLNSLTGADYAESSNKTGAKTVALFDGKTLDGWVTLDDQPITRGWEVVDGTLHVKRGKQRSGHIKTTRKFENFELEFEWKIAQGGNSGVKYFLKKSRSEWGNGYYGCEYQLLDDDQHKNGRTPTKTAGALYDLFAPDADKKQLRPVGDFNHSRIIVEHGRIEHWLNGQLIVQATIGSPEWQAKIEKSKFNSIADFAQGAGAIMLQDHRSEAWFRNIRITPFDGTTPIASPSPETKAE